MKSTPFCCIHLNQKMSRCMEKFESSNIETLFSHKPKLQNFNILILVESLLSPLDIQRGGGGGGGGGAQRVAGNILAFHHSGVRFVYQADLK